MTPDGIAPPLGRAVWDDTRIEIGSVQPFRDVFTGAIVQPAPNGDGYAIPAAAIFERFPVARLVPADRSERPALCGRHA